jgi:predicted O-methyltransferase YrrM
MLRYRFRLFAVWLTSLIPTPLLRAFLKSFDLRQELAEAAGYNVVRREFFSPIPEIETIDWGRVREPRNPPGVDLNIRHALELLPRLAAYAHELDGIPYEKTSAATFWFNNKSFTDFDAAVLYALLRERKPKRYIEVGCGFSSLVSAMALERNLAEGRACRATYIDPAPRLELRERLAFAELRLAPIQKVPLDVFQELNAGDVLFIDTSHVLKLQGDVEYELLHILPSLRSGVMIQIHDIFTPYEYPEDWLTTAVRFAGNEQYAVECLLSGGNRFQVELPLYCLWRQQREALQKLLPRGVTRPQSLWISRVQ